MTTNSLKKFEKALLITGGAGFIGSNLLRYMVIRHPRWLFVNLDKLTYAGNLSSLRDIEMAENYLFACGDIGDRELVKELFEVYNFDGLINLAAESHVDRSILGPEKFLTVNIMGTYNLLEIARQPSLLKKDFRFHQVSTDEVFGSLEEDKKFCEKSPYAPNSPYAASKASADHLVRAYHKTYGLNAVTSNCSNNFGPYQFPEKMIPLIINNGLRKKPLPVYGDGCQIRDWLYVIDHCRAIELVFLQGETGKTYNIGADHQLKNIDLVQQICRLLDEFTGENGHEDLIRFVEDRPGHDRHYALDASFIKAELGWRAQYDFEESLRETVKWYMENQEWVEGCLSGDYKNYYNVWYSKRLESK